MEELFDKEGHLTDNAFAMLADNKLDELQRLEIAEHNSLCDKCLDRYITYVEKSEVITPSEIMKKRILNKISFDTKKFYLNQYISVTISACFAMLFWITGAFSVSNNYKLISFTNGFAQKTVEITQNISNKFNQTFNNIILEDISCNKKSDIS